MKKHIAILALTLAAPVTALAAAAAPSHQGEHHAAPFVVNPGASFFKDWRCAGLGGGRLVCYPPRGGKAIQGRLYRPSLMNPLQWVRSK